MFYELIYIYIYIYIYIHVLYPIFRKQPLCICKGKAAYNIPPPYLRIAKSLWAMGYEVFFFFIIISYIFYNNGITILDTHPIGYTYCICTTYYHTNKKDASFFCKTRFHYMLTKINPKSFFTQNFLTHIFPYWMVLLNDKPKDMNVISYDP